MMVAASAFGSNSSQGGKTDERHAIQAQICININIFMNETNINILLASSTSIQL